jgi:hypothetical protein
LNRYLETGSYQEVFIEENAGILGQFVSTLAFGFRVAYQGHGALRLSLRGTRS